MKFKKKITTLSNLYLYHLKMISFLTFFKDCEYGSCIKSTTANLDCRLCSMFIFLFRDQISQLLLASKACNTPVALDYITFVRVSILKCSSTSSK